jgi:hypothetical protein
MPFHRVEVWEETHYADAWLWKAGIGIHLGHGGDGCPAYCGLVDTGPEEENEDDFGINTADLKPKTGIYNGGKVVCFVHINGIHFLPVYPCACPNAEPEDIQFIEMAFWLASYNNAKTAFTFQLLNDYLLDNLECKTSGQAYFTKLRRVTSRAFPNAVPDRYRELLRAGRQWRNVKDRKWFGFGHLDREPTAGELALFCAACPQPTINVPKNWTEDSEWYASISLKTMMRIMYIQQLEVRPWFCNGRQFYLLSL